MIHCADGCVQDAWQGSRSSVLGIAGLSAAYFLDSRHAVTVYEKETRLGGHSRTVTVDYDGRAIPVDTGFIVFNRRNYPNLTSLFRMLGVAIKDSDMSFGFSTGGGTLEWGARSLNAVFGQRRNMLRPKFLKLFLDVMRFNSTSRTRWNARPASPLANCSRRCGWARRSAGTISCRWRARSGVVRRSRCSSFRRRSSCASSPITISCR